MRRSHRARRGWAGSIVVALLAIPLMLPAAALAMASPALQSAGQVAVAGVTVSYGDAWVYDADGSVPDERIYLDAADDSLLRFYGVFVEENPGIGAVRARDGFAGAYLENIGATSVEELGAGEPSLGTAWSAQGAELMGSPMTMLLYVDVASAAGQIRVHMLITDPDDLHPALTEAQSSIQVDGAPAFRDLDPASVPGVTAAAALPAVYRGTWEGTGTEPDPNETWPVTVAFRGGGADEVVGTATYPTLACSGELILRGVDPATGSIEVTEDITIGEDACVDGGTFAFAATADGRQITFTWTGPETDGVATGSLAPSASTSQTVGAATVTFSAGWEAEPAGKNPGSIHLSHAQLPGTIYLYTEVAEPAAIDTASVFAAFEEGVFSGFGDGDQQLVASGALTPGTEWRLYTVGQGSQPFGVLVTADVTSTPGTAVTSILIAPREAFGLASQIVLDTIDRNGTGSPLAGLSAADIEAAVAAPGP